MKVGSTSPKATPSEEESSIGKPKQSPATRVNHPKAYTMTRKAATGWRATIRLSGEWGVGCRITAAVDMIVSFLGHETWTAVPGYKRTAIQEGWVIAPSVGSLGPPWRRRVR